MLPAWRRRAIRSIARRWVHGRRVAVPANDLNGWINGFICRSILLEILVNLGHVFHPRNFLSLPGLDPKHPRKMGSDHWGHQLVTKQLIQRFSHSKAGLNPTEIPTAVAVGSHNYSCCSYSPVAACKTPTPLVLAHVTEICRKFSLVA